MTGAVDKEAGPHGPADRLALAVADVVEVCGVCTAGSAAGSGRLPATVACLASSADHHLATVDTLARLALWGRRRGIAVRVDGAGPVLAALVDLVGLCALLEPGRQTEAPDQR